MIDEKIGPTIYEIRSIANRELKRRVHVNVLKDYDSSQIEEKNMLQEAHEDTEEFIIEKVVAHREGQLLIHWEGFEDDYDSWEPIKEVEHVQVVKDYLNANKLNTRGKKAKN